MYGSVDYLTRQATFKQVSPAYPITQEIEGSTEDPALIEGMSYFQCDVSGSIDVAIPPAESKKDLVTDLLRKAKQIEYLIDALPIPSDDSPSNQNLRNDGESAQNLERDNNDETAEEDQDSEFIGLESELKEVNEEFLQVLQQAGEQALPDFAGFQLIQVDSPRQTCRGPAKSAQEYYTHHAERTSSAIAEPCNSGLDRAGRQ
jgi:mediator of RNA polymerase II transcription subunit 21